jgi:DNA mismatch repair protein MutL
MGRIRVLSDNVANKIAAGEVVERPASVVKELLENSLDAGASSIRVDVESGGRRLIRITDDGCGMLRDDAMLAFERHATSKLSDVHDLLSIATLGFRGEALPSIASVSRLTLETRAREEETGSFVEIAGGKMLKSEEAALAAGTIITVRDLFFNVPARKKFLRTDQTELAHIASLVTHYSLAHPDKTFQLTHGVNELLRVSPVAEMRERVYQVFGSQVLDELVDLGVEESELKLPPPYMPPTASVTAQLNAFEDDEEEGEEANLRVFCLRGFVSRPQIQKSNRNSVYLFVNGRLIRDKLLLHAISSAYHNLIPPGCYPFALLFLDCDAREVDVNVHPSKTEVRFRHASHVHDFVRDRIRGRLMESRPAPSFPVPVSPLTRQPVSEQPQAGAALPYSEFTQQLENERLAEIPSLLPEAPPNEELPSYTLQRPNSPEPRFDFSGEKIDVPRHDIQPLTSLPVPDTHGGFPAGAILDEPGTLASLKDLRPLGQLHESFIIAAGRDGLWIIDQHVAHERILFEQVLKQSASGKVEMQHLLMPILIELSAGQQLEYARIADELNRMGFETELFGLRTIAVKAAPAGIGPADVERLIYEVLEIAEKELRRVSLDDLRRGIAASVACRAAIKINMRLDQGKMEWLLHALGQTDCPMSCPHGRPVALRYSMRDILKSFHRI